VGIRLKVIAFDDPSANDWLVVNQLAIQGVGVFAGAGDLLGESPKQANSRQELRDLLANRPSGGILFTTIQKFSTAPNEGPFPALSCRRNIVVICDEAHRTQYGFKGRFDTKTGTIVKRHPLLVLWRHENWST
jgi:type I site-specific restriction-modification system R (restriction) subunit